MPEIRKVLLVHAYEIDSSGKLGALAKTVCEKVFLIHEKFTHIILMGGWHHKDSPCTLGQAMKNYLLSRSIPSDKLYTREDLGLAEYMPTRDTMEEVDFAPRVLRKLNIDPLGGKFWAIGVWFFWPRLWLLYKVRGTKKVRILAAWSLVTFMPKRILWQLVGLRNLFLDPLGKGEHTIMHRKTRTLDEESKYLANTPNAWK